MYMNERIKQLLRQAGVGDNWNEEDWYSLSPKMVEKFAQLIVQECAGVCDLYAMPDGTSHTAIILASAIRRKFGIE